MPRRPAHRPLVSCSDVLVTNGLDVVQTDTDGRYTLSVTEETIISIVKPTGYKVPVDGHNLPSFITSISPTGRRQS